MTMIRMIGSLGIWNIFVLVLVCTAWALTPAAGADELKYQSPPGPIARIVDVPPTPSASLSPDRRTALLIERPSFMSIEEVSQPELRLAGIRINPKTNGPSRGSYISKLYLLDLTTPQAKPVFIEGLPANDHLSYPSWSPDGKKIAITATGEKAVTLWLVDVQSARGTPLIDSPLNACYGSPYLWVSDGTIIAQLVVPGRGSEPAKSLVPEGPVVQENDGKKRPARTEPDLLKNPHDEKLFDYFFQSQLVRIRLDGHVEPIGKPDIYGLLDASPDAKHLLVSTIHRPYSYKVSIDRFPQKVEIWSPSGKLEKLIVDNPLKDEVPVDFDAVPTGPRYFRWRDDADATLTWVEARDGGDPKKECQVRDELLSWAAPFSGEPHKLAQFTLRYAGASWGDGHLALLTERWWKNRKTRTFVVAPDDPDSKPRLLWDRSYEDRYSDPGNPLFDRTARGTWILHRTTSGDLLLTGAGASSEGDRPFLDRLDLKSLSASRLWRSQAPYYEYVSQVLDGDGDKVMTRRESVSDPPQYFVKTLSDKGARQVTDFPNPNPELSKVTKKLLQYQRDDGLKLSGMLYLPPGFEPGKSKPVPLLMWTYPQEFKSKEAAGQIQDSPYRFVRVSAYGPLFALLMGYAVLDDPTFPIVGEGKTEPNDTYVKQLVASADAAANEVARLGVADKDRLAIGGHSYGAFTTANLLAHSDIFRAGIARSGAYNRTLTPFGFQSEERTFWQAKDTYIEMSPFTYADKIDEPLLLIHGDADNNSGTYPIQSERLFEAMKGLGGRVRLVMLPSETHGYRARQSMLHTLWEMTEWLEKNVRNAPGRNKAALK